MGLIFDQSDDSTQDRVSVTSKHTCHIADVSEEPSRAPQHRPGHSRDAPPGQSPPFAQGARKRSPSSGLSVPLSITILARVLEPAGCYQPNLTVDPKDIYCLLHILCQQVPLLSALLPVSPV